MRKKLFAIGVTLLVQVLLGTIIGVLYQPHNQYATGTTNLDPKIVQAKAAQIKIATGLARELKLAGAPVYKSTVANQANLINRYSDCPLGRGLYTASATVGDSTTEPDIEADTFEAYNKLANAKRERLQTALDKVLADPTLPAYEHKSGIGLVRFRSLNVYLSVTGGDTYVDVDAAPDSFPGPGDNMIEECIPLDRLPMTAKDQEYLP